MKLGVVLPFLLFTSGAAFAPLSVSQRQFGVARHMSDDDYEPMAGEGALVPVKRETVEFTAGLIGGVAGVALAGPLAGAVAATAANYASKADGEVSEVVNALSKSSIQVYNYLYKLDQKYQVLEKTQGALETTLDKIKTNDSIPQETVAKVENALASTSSKLVEINDEYDLVGAGVTALGVIGDLVEKAVKTAGELNEEYQLTDRALTALGSAVSKAKTAAQTQIDKIET